MTRLPSAALQAAALLRTACAERLSAGRASSLVLARRRGVSVEPDGFLPNSLFRGVLVDTTLSEREGPQPEMLPKLSLSVWDSDCLK